uniref:MyTH4 domain-containing protein n=1 Tax=Coturnix japonica TaxID=93934 RepID=A0A8C2YHG8_COTJA
MHGWRGTVCSAACMGWWEGVPSWCVVPSCLYILLSFLLKQLNQSLPHHKNTDQGPPPHVHCHLLLVFRRAEVHFQMGWTRNCLIPQFFLSHRESVLRGWLLLSLLTGFFLPSNILMPYATKFLQQASSDPSNIAKNCQSNLRKNVMYGGRRHLPFPVEMEALLKGRSARRLEVLMFGGVEYVTRIRTFTVAKELLQEICEQMGAGEQEEMQEFALFAIRNKIVRPIRMDEYLHDYLLEDMLVTVSLRRLIWKTPLHFEDKIYTDVHYGQVRGILGTAFFSLKEYIPKPLQSVISTETLQNHLDRLLRTMQPLRPVDAKIQFIEHVMKLPFFGYNIFLVKKVSDSTIPRHILLGQNQMYLFCVTQELCLTIPLKELQRMRTLRPTSEQGLPGIELNYGSAASPRTLWIELPQAKEMYHTTILRRMSPQNIHDLSCFLQLLPQRWRVS